MNDDATLNNSRTLSIINFILGVWLIISPYVLGYSTAQAHWQQVIAGIIVAVMAAVRYFIPTARWASWVNAVVAVWLIIAPFVTGYQTTAAYWNEIITAIVVGALALWNAGLSTSGLHTTGHTV